MPLLGAIAGCHCSVLSWGKGRVTANFGGCHCSLLWFGGRVTTNFGGVDGGRCWVPLQVMCYGWGRGHFFFTLITQKLVFAIWGLCWYNMLFLLKFAFLFGKRYTVVAVIVAVIQLSGEVAVSFGQREAERAQ